MTAVISFCTLIEPSALAFFEKNFPFNINQIKTFTDAEWIIGIPSEIYNDFTIRSNRIEVNDQVKFISLDSKKHQDKAAAINHLFSLSIGDLFFYAPSGYSFGEKLDQYILNEFKKNHNIVVRGDTEGRHYFLKSSLSVFCVKKEDFFKLKGIKNVPSGYQEIDFGNKVIKKLGRSEVVITNGGFLQSEGDDLQNYDSAELEGIYIHPISSAVSQVLILLKNGAFKFGQLLYDPKLFLPCVLSESKWQEGVFDLNQQGRIEVDRDTHLVLANENYAKGSDVFFKLKNEQLIKSFVMYFDLITNFQKYTKS